MCGLAGGLLNRRDGLRQERLQQLGTAMATILRHRGPDGTACWTDQGLVLAHTRLKVIDVSPASNQPMHDDTGTVHLVFNGEIYNFRELRTELEAAGYRFRSRGDTEVIVNGYRQWGSDVFARLTGMFAIAIWDSQRERLVLARDRFGEKPLYYMERPEGLLFGSEIKAILTWPGVPRRANLAALHDFLSFGYTIGETAYQGIKRLAPAHYIVCERGRPPAVERYWRLPAPGDDPVCGGVEDLKHELVERLRAAVEMCLVSDVPLGAFLSGGVDSSAVVATMAYTHAGPIESFSSGFGSSDYDETRYARLVAERYATNHHVFVYDSKIIANMPRLAWHYDEPFSDSSALVTFALASEVRQQVTVALTGDGADETLLGYPRYLRYGAMRRHNPAEGGRRLPELYRAPGGDVVGRRPAGDTYGSLVETFRERHKLVGYDLAMLPYLDHCSYDRLLPHVVDGLTYEEQAARIDLATYLPGDLLVKVDIAAMAHGLETRAPFLNHHLVEWISRLPACRKLWDKEPKALLKAALEPLVPPECLYRPKVGFRVPVAQFLREDIRQQVESTLLSERFADRRLIRREFVTDMLVEHHRRQQDHGTRLWNLLILEMWFRTWIDSDGHRPLAGPDDPFVELGGDPSPHVSVPNFSLRNGQYSVRS